MRRPQAGIALVITLLSLVMMLVFLVLAFAATEMTGRVATRYRNATMAEQAARAGLAITLQYLQSDPAFNQTVTGWMADNREQAEQASQQQARGQLPSLAGYQVTFVPGTGAFSTNNLSNATSSVPGYQRTVPPGCCHVVSVGSFQGAIARVEALAHFDRPNTLQILASWGD